MSEASVACAGLAALAQRELALVEAGAADELAAVHAERLVLLAAVGPADAVRSPADRRRLAEAARTQLLAAEAMRQQRDALGRELGRSGDVRRAVAGYRASTAV